MVIYSTKIAVEKFQNCFILTFILYLYLGLKAHNVHVLSIEIIQNVYTYAIYASILCESLYIRISYHIAYHKCKRKPK